MAIERDRDKKQKERDGRRSRKKETEEELERNECPRVTCKQRLKTEGYRFTTVLMKMEEERDGENTDRTGMFKTKHRKTKN